MARLHFERGASLTEKGDHEGALQAWRTSIAIAPSEPAPYFAISDLLQSRNDLPESIKTLEALRRANPSATHADCKLAYSYLQTGRWVKAVRLAHEAKKATPGCPLGLASLGLAYSAAGDHQHAAQELERARKIEPANELIALYLAQEYARSRRPGSGLSLVDEILPRSSNPARASYVKGWLLAEYGPKGAPAPEQALPYLQQALEANPGQPAANTTMGLALLRLDRLREARSHLEGALKADPSSVQAVTALGQLYARAGHPQAQELAAGARRLAAREQRLRTARRRFLADDSDRSNNLVLAELEGDHGNTADALDLVREVLRHNPDDPAALNLLNRAVTQR